MVAIPLDIIVKGLQLAVIGMAFVFIVLFGIEIMIRITGKVFGPKVQVSQSPPTTETKEGG